MSLEYKSTGALIDERYTAFMKAQAVPTQENVQRCLKLEQLIVDRLSDISQSTKNNLALLLPKLYVQLRACWDAQEIFRDYSGLTEEEINSGDYDTYRLAQAGIIAQRTNAARCKLVREIDAVLGESDCTYLEKTYA